MDRTITVSDHDLSVIASALRNEHARIERKADHARQNGHTTETLDHIMSDLHKVRVKIERQA